MNSPSRVDNDIKRARETLAGMVRWPQRRQAHAALKRSQIVMKRTGQRITTFPPKRPVAALRHVRDVGKIAGLLCTDQSVAPSFGNEPPSRRKLHVYGRCGKGVHGRLPSLQERSYQRPPRRKAEEIIQSSRIASARVHCHDRVQHHLFQQQMRLREIPAIVAIHRIRDAEVTHMERIRHQL